MNLWNKFDKGRYAIVPCKMKNKIKETDFEFRIYSEKNKRINIKRSKGNRDFKLLQEISMSEIERGQYDRMLSLL